MSQKKSRRDSSKNGASGTQSFMTELRNMEEETSWICKCRECQLTMPERSRNRNSSAYSRSTRTPTTETSLSKTSFSSYCDDETCCLHNRPCAIANLNNDYKWSNPSSHTVYENISLGTSVASLPPPPLSSTTSQSSAYDSDAASRRLKSRNGSKQQSFASSSKQRDSCFLHGSNCAEEADIFTDVDVFHDNSLVFLRSHAPKVEDDTKTLFENKKNAQKKKKHKALTLIELEGCENEDVCCRHGQKCEISKAQPTEIQPLSVKEIFDLTDPKAGSQPASEDYENIGAIPAKGSTPSKSTLNCESSKTNCLDYENVEFAEEHMLLEKEFPLSRKQSLRLHSTPSSQLPVENSKDLDKKRASDQKEDQLEKLQKERDVKVQELKKQLEVARKNEAKALDEVKKCKQQLKELYLAMKHIVSFGSNLI